LPKGNAEGDVGIWASNTPWPCHLRSRYRVLDHPLSRMIAVSGAAHHESDR